jgi:hypothetical protein
MSEMTLILAQENSGRAVIRSRFSRRMHQQGSGSIKFHTLPLCIALNETLISPIYFSMESVLMPGYICDNPIAVRAMITPVRITYTTSLMRSSIEAVSSFVKEGIFLW